tara:strand:- start:75 stop:326 length:252 start_codon:yes stop_codon:yes gene_type:complete
MPRFIEKKMDDAEVGSVKLLQRDDGLWAIPGGGHVINKGYALQIAKRLNHKHPNIKSPIAKLADKTVNRIEYSMRSDRSLMGA